MKSAKTRMIPVKLSLALVLLAAVPPLQAAITNDQCMECHQEKGFTKEVGGKPVSLYVDPAKAPAKSDYKGQTYYFCAPGCKKAFDKEPEKFLKK